MASRLGTSYFPSGRELAALLVDGTDRSGIRLGDDELRWSMGRRVVGGKPRGRERPHSPSSTIFRNGPVLAMLARREAAYAVVPLWQRIQPSAATGRRRRVIRSTLGLAPARVARSGSEVGASSPMSPADRQAAMSRHAVSSPRPGSRSCSVCIADPAVASQAWPGRASQLRVVC
jgi:hypothetical protein